MTIAAVTNLSSFEDRLKSILVSKEEVVRKMREDDRAIFEKYGTKTAEQIQLHEHFHQQPKTLKTGIHFRIDSALDAINVHNQIRKLIDANGYPVKETDWFNFNGTDTWYFGFEY